MSHRSLLEEFGAILQEKKVAKAKDKSPFKNKSTIGPSGAKGFNQRKVKAKGQWDCKCSKPYKCICKDTFNKNKKKEVNIKKTYKEKYNKAYRKAVAKKAKDKAKAAKAKKAG